MKATNVDVEWRVIVTLVLGPDPMIIGLMLSKLRKEHFGHEVTQPLYETIAAYAAKYGKSPTYQTLYQVPGVDPNTMKLLAGESQKTSPPVSEEDALMLVDVLDKHRLARLLATHTQGLVTDIGVDVIDFDKVRKDTEKVLVDLTSTSDDAPLWHFGTGNNADELIQSVLCREKLPGIPSGFHSFDSRTGGWNRGNFVALASHFKGGKSITSLTMALNQAKLGYNVLYLPFEMAANEVAERQISALSGIDSDTVRLGKCTPTELRQGQLAYVQFKNELTAKGSRFTMHAVPTMSTAQLVARFKGMKYDVIYLDYLNLMEPSDKRIRIDNDAHRINIIGAEVKKAASTMNALIIGLTQLDDKTEDLRYSKSLKEHCNNVWTWMYKDAQIATGIIEVTQMAARSWEPFKFNLKAEFKYSRVADAPTQDMFGSGGWGNDTGLDPNESMFKGDW